MPKAVGIDLGTTLSEIAVMEGGEPVIIASAEGARLVPSVVAVTKAGERLVGVLAKRQAITNPENTIYNIKRFMGRKFGEPIGRELPVEEDAKRVPYKVTRAPNGDVRVVMGGKEHSPPEISAMILQKLKTDAEAYLGDKVTEAVITVPAYFNDAQRQATKDAGEIAGLKVLRIINEPTASALAYGMGKKKEGIIAIYDLGGGTFDISILEIGEGTFQVKSTAGNTHLGGEDFDQRTVEWLVQEFRRESGIDLRQDRMALQRLKEAAEKAKVELSTVMEAEINLPFITADASGPKHLSTKLTRAKLEQLVEDLVEQTIEPCRQAVADAGLHGEQINEVLLVGGQSRMPLVQKRVSEFFRREPSKGVNPDEAVALGAAIQAGVLKGEVKEVLLLDVTPLTLSIETLGGVATPLIQRNTTIPTSKSQVFSTAGDGQTQVEIHVTQGERAMAGDNKSLGRFILDGILPAPRGVPQIEVAFDIDANGILSVRAKDLGTAREQKMIIQPSSGLTKDEVEKMKRAAEQAGAEDARRRQEVEARNNADSLAYQAEKMLREMGDKVPPDLKAQVEQKVGAVRTALQGQDGAAVQRAAQDLSETLQRVGAAVYQKAGAGAGTGGGPPPGGEQPPQGGDKGTVEGEFREG